MSRVLIAIVILVAAIAGGCSRSDGAQQEAASGMGCENDGHYFVFQDPDWEFKEAVDYPPDLGPLAAIEPSLDWYAEHERVVPTSDPDTVEGLSLRISGHEASMAEHAKELVGADLSETQIDGQQAYVGAGPGGTPGFVTIAAGDDYTLMLLSYGLSPDQLTEIAGEVEPVCQQGWLEAGGQVLDCMPTEPGCIQSP